MGNASEPAEYWNRSIQSRMMGDYLGMVRQGCTRKWRRKMKQFGGDFGDMPNHGGSASRGW